MIKTKDEARLLILKEGICALFKTDIDSVVALWDVVDLPDRQPGERGFGKRVGAIWKWKNALPEEFPDEIFFGKIKGGAAALMSLDYLKNVHYKAYHRPVESCRDLAQRVYELVRLDPWETGPLRKESMERFGCTKSRFEGALKELQITLNIVRANDPGLERDTWVRFEDLYLEIIEEMRGGDGG
jgi:hypothetical protein